MITDTVPKPITSCQKTEIVDKLALEIPQRKIASQYHISQSRVSKINIEEEELVKERKKELQALAPNILEEFRYDCLTATELSKHLYRPLEFKNQTALQNNQDIISHKNSLKTQKLRILEGTGILDTNAIPYGDINIVNNQIISPAFQQYIDFQAKNGYENDENNENNA